MILKMNSIERLPVDSAALRTFLAVAEAGNVTHAAARLGRTQSAISVQIRKLEAALAVRLFERRARGMVVTAEGERLLPAARRAVAELDRIGGLFARPLVGRIRVGIPDDYGAAVLERALAAFAAHHPDVEVFVRCGFSVGFPEAIRRNELDLAVNAAKQQAGCDELIMAEPTAWAAGPDTPPPGDGPVRLALFDRSCWWRDAALEALERAGRRYEIAYSSESVAGVKAAISAGLAVGVLAVSTMDRGMRVLGRPEGFPPLPASSLVFLQAADASEEIVAEMKRAIRLAFSPVAAAAS